jgi:hypothetical protein
MFTLHRVKVHHRLFGCTVVVEKQNGAWKAVDFIDEWIT